MKRIINWGLIGLGNASLNLAKEFNNLDNSKLYAVASRTKEKRDYFKKKFNLKKKDIYSNYSSIFKNQNIDIVYIGLPNSMHEKFCLEALKYNKNVLVEKPITINFKIFRKIKKEFKKKNLLIEEGTANKFHPFYQDAIDILKKIKFSKILKIKTSFGNDALGGKKIFGIRLKKINHKKRLFNKDLNGGSILDGGIYPVSLIVDILSQYDANFIKDIKINNCVKNFSKGVDLSSKLSCSFKNTKIEIKTSLLEKLNNNLEIYTNEKIIKLQNIFNISSDSLMIFNENKDVKIIKNNYGKSAYYYEIEKISNLLIKNFKVNNKFIKSLDKIEKNIKLLSKWTEC